MAILHLLVVLAPVHALPELEDYPGCGLKNNQGEDKLQASHECLWDCQWIQNPFFGKIWDVRVTDQDIRDPDRSNFKTIFNVKYFMSTPRIPKDIRCLKDCRNTLPLKVIQLP